MATNQNRAQRLFLKSLVRTGAPIRTRAGQPLPTAVQDRGSRRPRSWQEGEADIAGAFRNGIGMDSYPLPMIQHIESDRNLGDFAPANFPNGVPVAILPLADGTAADMFMIEWEFTIPAQQDVLSIAILKNGEPFINRLYQRSYNELITLYKKIDTGSNIEVVAVQNPGTVLVPPLGRIRTRIIVYGYRGTYVG